MMKLLTICRVFMGCVILIFAGIGIWFVSVIGHEFVHSLQDPGEVEPKSLCYDFGMSYEGTPIMGHVAWDTPPEDVGDSWKTWAEVQAYGLQYAGVALIILFVYFTGKITGRTEELKRIMKENNIEVFVWKKNKKKGKHSGLQA